MGYLNFSIAAVIIFAVGFLSWAFRQWVHDRRQDRIVARIMRRA